MASAETPQAASSRKMGEHDGSEIGCIGILNTVYRCNQFLTRRARPFCGCWPPEEFLPMPYSGVAFPQFERPKSMKLHVYEALKAAILAGSIDHQTVLTEATLAEKFGVSRTPIREVMHELERQGLLERAGPRGKRVRSVSAGEVCELFWIRSVLEPPIASQLARSGLAEGDLKQLNLLLERQRNALCARDRAEFLAADSAFHILLARFTGFRKVTEI